MKIELDLEFAKDNGLEMAIRFGYLKANPKSTKKEISDALDFIFPKPANKDEFETVWKLYPNKKGSKSKAFAKYRKLKKEIREIIPSAIKREMRTQQWSNGYIPHFTTWLNGSRWETAFENPGFKTEIPLDAYC